MILGVGSSKQRPGYARPIGDGGKTGRHQLRRGRQALMDLFPDMLA